MANVIITIIAGLIGTGGMTLVMWLISKSGMANADMVRAIGSLFSRDLDESLAPGLIIHFIIGALIAFIYVILISLFHPTSVAATIGTGAMIGVFHGVAFSFLLVVAVAEHHPLEHFRNAGLEVALAHLVGHVVYGLLVGTVIGIAGVRFF
jgi:uncharacterized membrane protein YagU involved in acid resistance